MNSLLLQSKAIASFALHQVGMVKLLNQYVGWLFTPPHPLDRGMAPTAISVDAINPIEQAREKSGSPFRTSREYKLPTGSPTTNKADCHWWVPKSRLLRHAG